jgi:hypothetical protein
VGHGSHASVLSICEPQMMQIAVLLETKSTLQLKSTLILKLPANPKGTNDDEKQLCKVAPIRIAHFVSRIPRTNV